MTISTTPAVILAGGRGERLRIGLQGSKSASESLDKCLLPLAGRTMLDHILERLQGQVEPLVLNANGDTARFSAFGLPIVEDMPGSSGPLAGVLTGLEYLGTQYRWMLSVPGDCPFLPRTLLAKLASASSEVDAVVARSDGRDHYTVALWSTGLKQALQTYLGSGQRSVAGFLDTLPWRSVEFSNEGIDPFFNINKVEHWHAAEHWAQQHT